MRDSATPGMRDTPTIALPRGCTIADGVNGYALAHAVSGLVLERRQVGLLRSHHQQIIGWMRCTEDQVA
ncbi:MAG TPA: hypothetical protein VEN78_02075, partial [Bradyrhizobium sp.]|nr:hypothetical protein [Bradyrhizobium sp.]